MITYPHPLDYATGQKYALTPLKLSAAFEISPESFYVEELVDFSKLALNKKRGNYAVLRVWKKGIDTLKALRIVSKLLDIPESNILLFGLKDKYAQSISYFFIKTTLFSGRESLLDSNNIKIELVGFVKSKPKRSYHVGNKFGIRIEGCKPDDLHNLKAIISLISTMGLPAYYGYQRFGYFRYNSHILGKSALLGREDSFAEALLREIYPLEPRGAAIKRLRGDFTELWYEDLYIKASLSSAFKKLMKMTRGLLIDSYASYLFNLLINEIIEKEGFDKLRTSNLPMPGCTEKIYYYEDIVLREGLTTDLLAKMPCFYRAGVFYTYENTIRKLDDKTVIYEFTLKPGMFATVVLRELFKENLVFKET